MIRRPPRSTLFPTRRSSDLSTSTSTRSARRSSAPDAASARHTANRSTSASFRATRSEEHTSELQSQSNLVCRLLLEKKKKTIDLLHSSMRRIYRLQHIVHLT